jgi:ectoine hydroxylase-related dioxygenase (phytanoyl-CoA dioxygenase family)
MLVIHSGQVAAALLREEHLDYDSVADVAVTKGRGGDMLTRDQVESYRRDGYLLIENVLSAAELDTVRCVVDELVEASRSVTAHDHVYDLEPTHSSAAPRVRRIKEPHNVHPAFREIAFSEKIADILTPLIGTTSGIRYQTGKLNMKSAGYGAAVEWHQDWAFYPHTNDDLLAIGLYLDDCGPDNGPLLVLPGSHTWPIADHHADGVFCGAIDPAADIDFSKAVALTGPAGSMTIHHVRMIHGSALNTSDRPRRLLLFQYTAVDAFPLMGIPSWERFNASIVTGEPTMHPRLTPVPVRIPLPAAPHEGSIYENQRSLGNRYFDVYGEAQTVKSS